MNTNKIIQALAYLASKEPNNTMEKMKAYKLLWLADRLHVRQSGRTITGDTYYAMPHGVVPSDAKCLLDNVPTKLEQEQGYLEQYIKPVDSYHYQTISTPDLRVFSDSDQEALDKVYEAYGNLTGKELSRLSHSFPEWTFYESLINDKDEKNSYRVDIDHFFEPCDADYKGLFAAESDELLSLTKQLYHEYNRI